MIYLDQEYALNFKRPNRFTSYKILYTGLYSTLILAYDLTCVIGITLDTRNITFVDINRNIWSSLSPSLSILIFDAVSIASPIYLP